MPIQNLTSEELNYILGRVATRRIRNLIIALILALTMIGLLIYSLWQNSNTQAQLKTQLAQGQQQIILNQQANKITLDAIQRRGDQLEANMLCIATAFTHSAGTITNIDFNNCKIQSDVTGTAATNTALPSTSNSTNSAQSDISAPQSTETGPSRGTASTPTPSLSPIVTVINNINKAIGATINTILNNLGLRLF